MRAVAIALAVALSGVGIARAQPTPPADQSEAPIVAPIEGELPASRLQREVVERWARLRALRTGYGEQHVDVVRARVMLLAAERELLSLGASVDRARVGAWIRAQIVDVDQRLSELSVSCQSGHPNVVSAQARRAALLEAQAAIEARGTFVPRVE